MAEFLYILRLKISLTSVIDTRQIKIFSIVFKRKTLIAEDDEVFIELVNFGQGTPPSPSAGLQIRGGTENNLANFTPY